MGKFIVTVIDGFGVGAMSDTHQTRKVDMHANTLTSIMRVYPSLSLPTLAKLGLGNIVKNKYEGLAPNALANWGTCALAHDGADTFMGHQEIMGSKPQKPVKQRLEESFDQVYHALQKAGHLVRVRNLKDFRYIIVDEGVVVSDNIDSDLGQAINCIASFDIIRFDQLLKIAAIVRRNVTCNRVIAFGGSHTTLQMLLDAEEIKEDTYVGNVAVKTGVYLHDYQVRHLGYGVDASVQVPTILAKHRIPVTLIGKVADIVHNEHGKNFNCVDSSEVLKLLEHAIKTMKHGFICTNVQESDLAGHSMDTAWYKDILQICDTYFERMLPLLDEEDIFVVCADHGNDPEIGHNRHTREYVPLLVYQKHKTGVRFGERSTLADIGASVCEYFNTESCAYGTSFLTMLKKTKN